MSQNDTSTKGINLNGSLSKTSHRKLKPISFCMIDNREKELLEKVEKIQYGNYLKNILDHLSEKDIENIQNSKKKSEPLMPTSLFEFNVKKGFLSCRSLAQSFVKLKMVDNLLHELRNFIPDSFILELAKDRNLLKPHESINQHQETMESTYDYDESLTNYKTPPPTVFSNKSVDHIKQLIRQHQKLSDDVDIDSEFIEQFIMENPNLFYQQTQ